MKKRNNAKHVTIVNGIIEQKAKEKETEDKETTHIY